MVFGGDCSAGAVRCGDRLVLVEGGGAHNRGLIIAMVQVNIVRASITSNCTHMCAARGWVIGTKVFDNVILRQGLVVEPYTEKQLLPFGYSYQRTQPTYSPVCMSVMIITLEQSFVSELSYFGPPGFHPFPPTKFQLPD